MTTDYAEALRGSADNDVFVAGDFGELLHYSGKTWHSYRTEVGLVGGVYYGLAVKGDIVIAVGEDPPNGVIVVGKRILWVSDLWGGSNPGLAQSGWFGS